MADNKITAPIRRRFATDTQGEVEHFARKYGLSVEQVADLIHQHGHNPARLDAAVLRMTD